MKILNEMPRRLPCNLAVVGEAPGSDEVQMGRPFVGPSGRILRNLLSNSGLDTTKTFIGNVCQEQPPNNNIAQLPWDGKRIQDGLAQLKRDIDACEPPMVLLLGQTAFRAAGRTEKISQWRGSLFMCEDVQSPFYGRKCLATYHPAAVLRMWDWMPLLRFDIERAKDECETRDLRFLARRSDLDLGPDELIERLRTLDVTKPLAFDIEGGVTQGVKCISFAQSPTDSFIVPFGKFSIEEELRLVAQVKATLEDGRLRKVLQNALYDTMCLAWEWGVATQNIWWDTMLSGWEIYPELPKSLGVQTSVWTKEPYYKYERTLGDTRILHSYCCKDSMITLEIQQAHERKLSGDALRHFHFNMRMLPILLYMELRGINYDKEEALRLHGRTTDVMKQLQSRLDERRGKHVNCNSPKQVCEFLYNELGLPVQHPKKGNSYDTTKRTVDASALLRLMKKSDDPVLQTLSAWRKVEKVRQALEYQEDRDGRMRCSYNVVGTTTGRLSSQKSTTGNGTNLQTITKKLRSLYRADPGYWFFQLDLEGADGWTVAAHCAKFGDQNMLEDYRVGLKPAKVILLMQKFGREVAKWDRARLLEEARPIGKDKETSMLYFACKRVQHGTNYLLGTRTMSMQILEDSHKLLGVPLNMRPKECEALQYMYLARYPGVRAWQRWVEQELKEKGTIRAASGHVRRFFGRRTDHKTLRDATAHEPQANTTYVTNLAANRLWNDPDNRRAGGLLWVEPLHQVHDALCGQFPKERTEWACQKLREWFDNPVTLAGQQIVIPFDGGYGPNWLETTTPI